ncbi:MAG: hypothetical protein ACRD2N_20495 [Vicinamibacterales bacterium]
MKSTGLALLILNAALAAVLAAGAPSQPARSDRLEYEYAGRNGLAPNCEHDVYCYRVLVPWVLERLPGDSDTRWRVYATTFKALAGFVTAVTTAYIVGAWQAPLLATVIAQTSFGFTLTAYDPYTPDPFVFLAAALFLLAWIRGWPWLAVVLSLVGVFAKETVVLLAGSTALAALWRWRQQPHWIVWALQAALSCAVILGFHWVMDTYFGWGIARNRASRFWEGSWIVIWYENMDSWRRIVFLLFIPFGFVWLFAPAGFRLAPDRLRALTLGALLPMLALNYVQNPERALGTAFFVIVPLAALFLSRVPVWLALAAALLNGLMTAKAGLSTTWLPSTSVLVIPAAASAMWALWVGWRTNRFEEPTRSRP